MNDNGSDTTGQTNYANQDRFNDIRISASPTKLVYPRDDFLLISPGPDGRYGYTNNNVPVSRFEGTCDDIVNW